jgi:hypothetical protein
MGAISPRSPSDALRITGESAVGRRPVEIRRTALVIAGLVAVAVLSFAISRPYYPRDAWPVNVRAMPVDFRAFYCAGAAVADHRDPYRTEPLRTCQNTARGFPAGRGLRFAVPAPLPGYAIAPFVLLSRLPHTAANGLFIAGVLASLAMSVVLLGRLCALRPETIFAALLLEGLYALFIGQIVPIVCAATIAAAYFVARGRDRLAALAAAIAMLEPHLGLPVCLALFIARPRARAALAGCGLLLAVGSIALLGLDANIEYLRDVLPAHVASELSNEEQYSLSYLAHLAGMGERNASGLGTFSYLVMLVVGVFAGRLAAARTGMPALLLLVPPAFAVLGGPFVHVQQLAVAIPAALVLSGTASLNARLCAGAVVLLAFPWTAAGFLALNLLVVAAVAFILALDLFGLTPIRAGIVSFASIAVTAALLGTFASLPPLAIGPIDPREGTALAENGWRTHVEATFQGSAAPYIAAKLFGWTGLILIAIATLGFPRDRSRTGRGRATAR